MRLILLLAIVACVALPAPAVAQPRPFPSKPLRILLGYTPGGTADIVARLAREGSEVIRTTPAEFARFVQAESRKYADIIKQINYKPE